MYFAVEGLDACMSANNCNSRKRAIRIMGTRKDLSRFALFP